MTCRLLHHDTGARCEKDWGHTDTQHYGYSHFPDQVVSWLERVRVDKRGRRIGDNWWRSYNMECFDAASAAVEAHREDNHQMEPDEYSTAFPLPQFKHFLIANKGMRSHEREAQP